MPISFSTQAEPHVILRPPRATSITFFHCEQTKFACWNVLFHTLRSVPPWSTYLNTSTPI